MSNSLLDEQGDVVLYNAADGTRWIFRDDVCHGLEMRGPALFKEGQSFPSAEIKAEGHDWVARWSNSGAVCFRHDTRYGLIAKVARKLLAPAKCCTGDALYPPKGERSDHQIPPSLDLRR